MAHRAALRKSLLSAAPDGRYMRAV